MQTLLSKHFYWIVPFLTLLILSPFTPYLDLYFAHHFYDNGFQDKPFYHFIYSYAIYPAQIVAIAAFFLLIASFFNEKSRPYRNYALLLVLTMLIGAGFIVHTVLKDHWGRPRPKQVIEFGGVQTFRPFYKPNFFHQPEPSRSFPCGHCTMGFYFFAVALVFKRLGKGSFQWASFFLAFLLGLLLGLARMAQGGHFFSDVLWSMLIMWLISYAFDQLLFKENVNERIDQAPARNI